MQPSRTLNPEFGQQCSRPVTQKRKSAVLSIQWLSMYIQHVYIFELPFLMSLFHLFDPLQMTRRIKLTSQNLKVIETRNIPDGTPATYKKSVEEETMGCNTGEGG